MAESINPIIAETLKVMVSATLPATLTAPAGYKMVGLQTGAPINRGKPSTTVRAKGLTLKIYGTIEHTQALGILAAADADDGQTILRNAQASGALVYFLRTSAVVGSTAWHYRGYVGGGQEADGVEGAVADAFEIAIVGTPVSFTVA